MEPDMPYLPGSVLRRKFKRGNFYHYGIASEYYHPDLGVQMIYQFGGPYLGDIGNDAGIGARLLNLVWNNGEGIHTGTRVGITDYLTFGDGLEIEVVEVPDDPIPVLDRAKEMLNRDDYNPVLRNCEHYANYALRGSWESSQAKMSVGRVFEGARLILRGLVRR